MDEQGYSFENLTHGFKVLISKDHRFGTDAFILSDFSAPRHKDNVLELCSGNGIISILMVRDFLPASITAIEIQEQAYYQLTQSVAQSCEEAKRITPVLGDLREWKPDRKFDVVVCNPPYKRSGAGIERESIAATIARHETECTALDVAKCAARSLRYGGRLCLCYRPERLADAISAMRECGIEPKRLRTVHKDENSEPWLILLEGRLGGSPSMRIEKPLFVNGKGNSGEYSDEVKRIYRLI